MWMSPFWRKRVMSLLGLVPLGAYVVLHLWTNLSALGGPEAFDAALAASRRHPAFLSLEILLGVALLIHTMVGVQLALRARPNNLEVRTLRNLKFAIQRLSGLLLAVALTAHVIKARILPAMGPTGVETWRGMHEAMKEPETLAIYVLMGLGISFHLANGLWTALITWGLTVTPRAQRRSEWVSAVFFATLLIMSWLPLYGFLQAEPGLAWR